MRKVWLLIVLTGCAVGPNYQAPENNVGDAWQLDAASIEKPLIAWWTSFEDPLLDRLIELTAAQNKDILAAEAAILRARAVRDVAASKFFPQLSADVSYVKTYFSKNGPLFSFTPGGGAGGGITSSTTGLPFNIQIPQIQNLYNALFDASWEIDLFGKIRRTVESAAAHIQSAIDAKNGVLLMALAETARAYMELRSFQQKSTLLETNISLLEEQLLIGQAQRQAGLINELDLASIEAALLSAKAALPDSIANVYRSIYTLSLLTGNLPEALADELFPSQPLPKPPEKIAVGLRSELLRRRPDVRQAERELAAATADIGVAVASFFPTFTLLGDGGFQSLNLNNLFSLPSRTWAYGGDLNMPVFQGGRLFGNLHIAQAQCQLQAAHYQQTVLTAVQEAETTLRSFLEDQKTALLQAEETGKMLQIANLTQAQFTQGLVNKMLWLQAKQNWLSSELTMLEIDARELIDLVALFKALGGGWQPEEEGSSVPQT